MKIVEEEESKLGSSFVGDHSGSMETVSEQDDLFMDDDMEVEGSKDGHGEPTPKEGSSNEIVCVGVDGKPFSFDVKNIVEEIVWSLFDGSNQSLEDFTTAAAAQPQDADALLERLKLACRSLPSSAVKTTLRIFLDEVKSYTEALSKEMGDLVPACPNLNAFLHAISGADLSPLVEASLPEDRIGSTEWESGGTDISKDGMEVEGSEEGSEETNQNGALNAALTDPEGKSSKFDMKQIILDNAMALFELGNAPLSTPEASGADGSIGKVQVACTSVSSYPMEKALQKFLLEVKSYMKALSKEVGEPSPVHPNLNAFMRAISDADLSLFVATSAHSPGGTRSTGSPSGQVNVSTNDMEIEKENKGESQGTTQGANSKAELMDSVRMPFDFDIEKAISEKAICVFDVKRALENFERSFATKPAVACESTTQQPVGFMRRLFGWKMEAASSESTEQSTTVCSSMPAFAIERALRLFHEEIKDSSGVVKKEMSEPASVNPNLEGFLQAMSNLDLSFLPKAKQEGFKGIVKVLQDTIQGGDNPSTCTLKIKRNVETLIRLVCPIDLPRLSTLLSANHDASDLIQGKDVLLFLGATGVGKTTTLLYLAGTKFTEVDEDGMEHLQPVEYPQGRLSSFEVNPGTRSVTECLQAHQVTLNGSTVTLCDTPGFFDTGGNLIELANAFGVTRAIQRARSVKPVLVLDLDSGRMQRLTQVLASIKSLFHYREGQVDFSAFEYVFTKCEKKKSATIVKQLLRKQRELTGEESSDPLFVALLSDIITKTRSGAHVVSPLEDPPEELLSSLLSNKASMISQPELYFTPMVSQGVLASLHQQLQTSLDYIEQAWIEDDADAVMYYGQPLIQLASDIPEADIFLSKARQNASDRCRLARESFDAALERCRGLVRHQRFVDEVCLARREINSFLRTNYMGRMLEEASASATSEAADITVFMESFQILSKAVHEETSSNDLSWNVDDVILRLLRFEQLCSVYSETLAEENFQRALNDAMDDCLDFIYSLDVNAADDIPVSAVNWTAVEIKMCLVGFVIEGVSKFIQRCDFSGRFTAAKVRWYEQTDILDSRLCKTLESGRVLQVNSSSLEEHTKISLEDLQEAIVVHRSLSQHPNLWQLFIKSYTGSTSQSFQKLEQVAADYLSNMLSLAKAEKHRCVKKDSDDLGSSKQKLEESLEVIGVGLAIVDRMRYWLSDRVSSEAHSVWKQLNMLDNEIQLYSAELDMDAREFAASLSKCCEEAKNFIGRLKSSKIKPEEALPKIASEWEAWNEALSKRRSWLKGLADWFFGRQTESASRNLEQAMETLLDFMSSELKGSFEALLFGDHVESPVTSRVDWLLRSEVQAFRFFFEYLKLCDAGSSFSICMLQKLGYQRNQVARVEVSIARAFRCLANRPHELLSNMDFRSIASLLDKMNNSSTWTLAKDYERSNMNTVDDSRREIRVAISECLTYEMVCSITERKLMDMVDSISRSSIRNYAVSNEYDRTAFYTKLASTLSALGASRCLGSFFPKKHLDCFFDSYEKGRAKFLKETDEILEDVMKLLSEFPSRRRDFPILNKLLENLVAVADAFGEDDPELSNRVKGHDLKLESCLFEHLKSFIEQHCDDSLDAIVKSLVLLKRASKIIGRWRNEIDRSISHFLTVGSSHSDGFFLLNLSLDLRGLPDDDAGIGLQIINEHECFAFAENALRISATAKQDIDNVLRSIAPESPTERRRLRTLYDSFLADYKGHVESGLVEIRRCGSIESYADVLSTLAFAIVEDNSVGYTEQVAELTAVLFAYWTLENIDKGSAVIFDEDKMGNSGWSYLRQPHAVQIFAAWIMLLNFSNFDCQDLENHFVEVKTGEGKSIVLGTVATILGLLGYSVSCVCYSEHLSERDLSDFSTMFNVFGVMDRIQYGTFDSLCSHFLDDHDAYPNTTRVAVRGFGTAFASKKTNHQLCPVESNKGKILLVDEVDFFFKKDFFGKQYSPVVGADSSVLVDLAKYIWANCSTLNDIEFLRSSTTHECVGILTTELKSIGEREIKSMLRDARVVKNGTNAPYHIADGEIKYKHLDGLGYWLYGYETMFCYMKEHEYGKITERAMLKQLYMQVRFGRLSYAELPVHFDFILGVTGTLQGLTQSEIKVLEDNYAVHRFTYMPSCYGSNRCTFSEDSSTDMLLCEREDHFMSLQNEIDRRRRPETSHEGFLRPVMVFFESTQKLLDFYEFLEPCLKKEWSVRTITEEVSPTEKKSYFLKATDRGAVTLMIREFGRGTDFKCFDQKLLDAGGVHVIQSFYSTDVSEFVQIKGRTARQGAKGSYSMVLCDSQLERDLGVSSIECSHLKSQGNIGSSLRKKRDEEYQHALSSSMQAVRDVEALHYRTLEFLQTLQRGQTNRRSEVYQFILEMNGCGKSNAFHGMDLKHEYIAFRQERIAGQQKAERERRCKSREKCPRICWGEDPSKVPTSEDFHQSNHYTVLGVARDATQQDIVRSHRALALKCHPDRCSDDSAIERFQLITQARETLLDKAKRAAYDRTLEKE